MLVGSIAVGVMGVAVCATAAVAATEDTKLTASDAAADDRFGRVAVWDDTIVVGAPLNDDAGTNSGSVYVYRPDGLGGYVETKLTASDAAADDHFGLSVAVWDDTIVVGAPLNDDAGTNSGSVYVYRPDGSGGYTETKLTASDGAAVDSFGRVAVWGDTIVVGAPFDDDAGTNSGSVYVFTGDGSGGYTQTAKLTASDASAGVVFGATVGVSGETIVVGAPFDDDAGTNSGSVYVFTGDGSGGYTQTAKLTPSDAGGGDSTLAVWGGTIVFGVPSDDEAGVLSGSVYVFAADGSGGYSETKLTASDAAAVDLFGRSVAVWDDTIVVGAPLDDDARLNSGSVYVYRPDGSGGYTETKLTASDASGSESFGDRVAVWGDTIVVGAPLDGDQGPFGAGSVYVFSGDFDGVAEERDLCPGTVLAESAPLLELKKNRYIANEYGEFVDVNGMSSGITVSDTFGCSGEQIIESAGLGEGHSRFGITKSALLDWIEANS